MHDLLRRLVRERGGQDLAEYGIALAVIGTGVVLIAIATANTVTAIWAQAQTALQGAL